MHRHPGLFYGILRLLPQVWVAFSCLMVYNTLAHPGVAQLVGRLVWDQDAASSSLATRIEKREMQSISFFLSGQETRTIKCKCPADTCPIPAGRNRHRNVPSLAARPPKREMQSISLFSIRSRDSSHKMQVSGGGTEKPAGKRRQKILNLSGFCAKINCHVMLTCHMPVPNARIGGKMAGISEK